MREEARGRLGKLKILMIPSVDKAEQITALQSTLKMLTSTNTVSAVSYYVTKCQQYGHFKLNYGYRNGLAVKNTDCSSRGPEFSSQQPGLVAYSHL